jgi:hypothetical protein
VLLLVCWSEWALPVFWWVFWWLGLGRFKTVIFSMIIKLAYFANMLVFAKFIFTLIPIKIPANIFFFFLVFGLIAVDLDRKLTRVFVDHNSYSARSHNG